MSDIAFSAEEKAILTDKLQGYLADEFAVELGRFDAEFLLDFIGRELGAYYYNRGLYDAQAVLAARVESISEAIDEIEKPTDFSR